ncbi:MAG: cellulose biosynthesis protein BcsS [Pseudolabrys sp.]
MLFAAAFVIGSVCLSARASRAADDEESRFILFSGRDIWANGVFMNGGLLFAPGGFEQDGFMFKLVIGSGAYLYNTDNVSSGRVIGFESTLQFLPGFRIKRGNLEMKFFLRDRLRKALAMAPRPAERSARQRHRPAHGG